MEPNRGTKRRGDPRDPQEPQPKRVIQSSTREPGATLNSPTEEEVFISGEYQSTLATGQVQREKGLRGDDFSLLEDGPLSPNTEATLAALDSQRGPTMLPRRSSVASSREEDPLFDFLKSPTIPSTAQLADGSSPFFGSSSTTPRSQHQIPAERDPMLARATVTPQLFPTAGGATLPAFHTPVRNAFGYSSGVVETGVPQAQTMQSAAATMPTMPRMAPPPSFLPPPTSPKYLTRQASASVTGYAPPPHPRTAISAPAAAPAAAPRPVVHAGDLAALRQYSTEALIFALALRHNQRSLEPEHYATLAALQDSQLVRLPGDVFRLQDSRTTGTAQRR